MPMMQRFSVVTVVGCMSLAACAQNTDSAMPPAATTGAVLAPAAGAGLISDLSKDVDGLEKKFVDLAKAMPDANFSWRPMPGTRSVREVFLHIAGENYLLPSLFGAAIPAASGIVGSDPKTVEAYEKSDIKKDSVVANIQASFANIKQAMAADSAAVMNSEIDFFGQKMSRQSGWIATVAHMHEHLGQAIAYARSNKVVPPWSK